MVIALMVVHPFGGQHWPDLQLLGCAQATLRQSRQMRSAIELGPLCGPLFDPVTIACYSLCRLINKIPMSADQTPDFHTLGPANLDWANTALWLLAIRKAELWVDDASSFTDFLDKYAKRMKKTPFIYWRGLAAAEFYLGFRDKHPDMNLPSLETLEKISPENLELVAKISRYAPDNMVQELMRDLLSKKIGRTLLKGTWEIFRGSIEDLDVIPIPLSEARTVKVRLVKSRENSARFRAEATLIARLLEQGWTWCCDSEPECYKFFPHVKIPIGQLSTPVVKAIDAVGVVAMRGGNVELHGVFVGRYQDGEIENRLADLAAYQPYLDRSWLAILGPVDDQLVTKIPPHVGVLEIWPQSSDDAKSIGVIGRGQPNDVEARLKAGRNSLRNAPVNRIRAPGPTAADGVKSGIVAKLLLTRN
jgi:hypothetical protein